MAGELEQLGRVHPCDHRGLGLRIELLFRQGVDHRLGQLRVAQVDQDANCPQQFKGSFRVGFEHGLHGRIVERGPFGNAQVVHGFGSAATTAGRGGTLGRAFVDGFFTFGHFLRGSLAVGRHVAKGILGRGFAFGRRFGLHRGLFGGSFFRGRLGRRFCSGGLLGCRFLSAQRRTTGD